MTAGTIMLMIGVALGQALTSAQNDPAPASPGAQPLALPHPGIPISFEQIEEHSRKLGGGSSAVESIISGKTYRDSAGAVRIESETRDAADHVLGSYVLLIDPTNGIRVILLKQERIAYRMPFPVSGESKTGSAYALDGTEPPHEWKVRSESAGHQIIEGVEFTGTLFTYIAEDEPSLEKSIVSWYSDTLKLTGAMTISGATEVCTVRIQNLLREEPDPELFRIPSDYKVVNLQLPLPVPL